MAKNQKPNTSLEATREHAAATIADLKEQYGQRASTLSEENEAKTRLLLVDLILLALGWDRKDFNPEQRAGTIGYTDYRMVTDGISRFVVEAKRVGHTFGNPRLGLRKIDYQLKYIRSTFGQPASDVINQAESYCNVTGIPFAIITNGAEWLLIQAIPFERQDIEDLRCIYFGNLLSDISNFELFWELLAKENVRNSSLEQYFSDLNSLPSEYYSTPSQQLSELNWFCSSTSENYLQDFYDYFFEEIIDPGRRTMLEACFVSNTRLDQYQGDLKRILKDTAPTYIEDAREISPENYGELLLSKSGDQKGRVILVTGSVGCGKSTLVTKVLVEARRSGQLTCLTVDLIDEISGDTNIFTQALWKDVSQKWKEENRDSYTYEKLKEIFWQELKALKAGPDARRFELNKQLWLDEESKKLKELTEDPEDFLARSWRYYSGQERKGIIVFLDNVDRASDEYQKLVYSFANKLARKTGATVIITMREVTYFRAQEFDFLDVRSHTVFHLQTPDLVQVLSKRIKYVEDLLGSGDHRLKAWRSRSDWQEFYDASLKYTEVLKITFLTSSDSSKAIGAMAAVAWHNVRYFLRCLKRLHSLLGSSEKWSISGIIAALMMPNSPVENQPALANLYLPPFKEYKCFFIKIRILLMLIFAKQNLEAQRGISLKTILNLTRMYRYQDRWTQRAVQEMVKQRLLECVQVPSEATYTKSYELQEEHSFRASPLAIVLIEQFQFDYIYLCMIGNDLPFHQVSALDNFVRSIEDIVDLLRGAALSDGVGLLAEASAGQIVAQYLITCLAEEQPLNKEAAKLPEVSIVEKKLEIIKENILKSANINSSNVVSDMDKYINRKKPKSKLHVQGEEQLSLLGVVDSPKLDEEDVADTPIKRHMPIPRAMESIKSFNTRLEPMIFWALVEIRARGQTLTIAAEIERTINQYLTDDHSKVEPTNIARKLRSRPMQDKPWLVTHRTESTDKKLYGISDNWAVYWKSIFDEEPSDLP
jgi:energy-coupling factor transporter ATP-binding protein EcfA2